MRRADWFLPVGRWYGWVVEEAEGAEGVREVVVEEGGGLAESGGEEAEELGGDRLEFCVECLSTVLESGTGGPDVGFCEVELGRKAAGESGKRSGGSDLEAFFKVVGASLRWEVADFEVNI